MKYKIEDILSIGSLNNTEGVTLTPIFKDDVDRACDVPSGHPVKVLITVDEFARISCNTQMMKEKAIQVLNDRGTYNDQLSVDQQITAEEGIAAIIYDGQETLGSELDENCTLHEEDCQVLSKSILLYVLSEFRPDLLN